MSTRASLADTEAVGRFSAVLKSLNEFDMAEVNGVLRSVQALSKNPRDSCFIGTYYRTIGNVETLLQLNNSKSFQAIVMLARALFELAVDIRLLTVIPDGCDKMVAFVDLEKLRGANKILTFSANNPTARIDTTTFTAFVAQNSASINARKAILWSGLGRLPHWSGMHMSDQVKLLKEPFEEIYEVNYPLLSWYTHAGLTGVVGISAASFTHLCGCAFHVAGRSYIESLLTVIREYEIGKANDKIEKLLELAKLLPWADSSEELAALRNAVE